MAAFDHGRTGGGVCVGPANGGVAVGTVDGGVAVGPAGPGVAVGNRIGGVAVGGTTVGGAIVGATVGGTAVGGAFVGRGGALVGDWSGKPLSAVATGVGSGKIGWVVAGDCVATMMIDPLPDVFGTRVIATTGANGVRPMTVASGGSRMTCPATNSARSRQLP
jgi:hypothetical protein